MTLFTALSLHAARQMLAAVVPSHDTPRRFRHAFLLAFARRIGERLAEADAVATRQVEAETGRSVAMVLVDRSRAVDDAVTAEFPGLRIITRQASSGAGIRSGRSAADSVALGQQVTGSGRRGLRTG